MRPTIVINLEGKDWRVTRLDSLDIRPLDEADERRGVVRYCPESERDEAREWVSRLTAEERVLTCVYCGHAYPPGSPEHGAEVLTEHIKVCEKHPIREMEAELATLKSASARSPVGNRDLQRRAWLDLFTRHLGDVTQDEALACLAMLEEATAP